MRHITIAGGVLALSAAVAACSGGTATTAQPTVKVHGTFDRTFASGTCSYAGEQVTITGPSGTVLATATLSASPTSETITVSGLKVPVQAYAYSATVPVEPRYGVTVGGLTPYHVTMGDFVRGVDLSC